MLPNSFETTIYTKVIEDKNKFLYYYKHIVFIAIFLCIVLKSYFAFTVALLSLIPLTLYSLYAYFDYEKLKVEGEGFLKIDYSAITLNDKIINWTDINKIKIERYDYEKMRIYRSSGNTDGHLSLGLKNKIQILTQNCEQFEYYFKVHSKTEFVFLNDFLWDLIKNVSFTYENAKDIVQPKNYKEHQELKKICKYK